MSDGGSQCFGAETSLAELGASPSLQLDMHPGYMVSRHTNLTPEQKKRVLEKLREIQAKTFVFVTAKKRGNDSLVSPVQSSTISLAHKYSSFRLPVPESKVYENPSAMI
jgi:hypothetical protein